MTNKIGKGSILLAALLGTLTTLLVTVVNIVTYPEIEVTHHNEYLLLFVMSILYLFGRRFKVKAFDIIAIAGIVLGIINLIGFNVILKLALKG